MNVATWVRERVLDRFARAEPAKRTTARVVSTWKEGKPLAPRDHYATLAQQLVRRNVLVSACIWEIVTSAAEPELVAETLKVVDGKPTWQRLPDSHDLAVILRDPNPEESQDEWLERLLTHQQIGGQWNLHKARSSSGRLSELWALRPDKLQVVPGRSGLIDRYVFTSEKGVDTLPRQDVVTCMLRADPLDDFYGLSPLSVLAIMGDLDNKAADYLRNFFYNGGTPAGLLKLKNVTLEPPDRLRLKQTWREEHSGEQGWHSVSVLDADAEYQEIGSKPDELKMEGIWDVTESRICSAFGVPAILVGANIGLKRATYANYKEARLSFWDETMPLVLRRTSSKLTKGVAAEWGANFRIRFDTTGVKALQKDAVEVSGQAMAEYNAGMITLNEARKKCGYDPIEGEEGDQRKAPPPPPAPGDERQGGQPGLEGQFGDLLSRRPTLHESHALLATAPVIQRRSALRKAAEEYFRAMGPDLVNHIKQQMEDAQ